MVVLRCLHAGSNGSMTAFPDQSMFLLHVARLGIGVASQITIYNGIPSSDSPNWVPFLLTLGKPVLGSLLVLIQQWPALDHMIWRLIHHTVLETLSENVNNFVVHHAIATELLIGFEAADYIVSVALIDGWHATELLVVPGIRLVIRFDNCFCFWEEE